MQLGSLQTYSAFKASELELLSSILPDLPGILRQNRSSAFAHTTQAIERRLAKNDLTKVIEVSRRKAFEGQASTLPLLAMLAVWLAVSTVPLLTMLAVWLDVHARARSALLLPIPM